MTGPLEGLKVLDFSTLLPGPYGTMMLADMGADVLRVGAPGGGDLRADASGAELNPVDLTLGRNKRSITVNLKSPDSRPIIERLVKSHDVFVEQFRPGVMDRLGWGYEAAKAVNPKIIYCSLTGYGQDGPYRDRAGHDINYLALSGLMSYTGRKDIGPSPISTQVADLCAGSYNMVVGILAALFHRERTGEGQHVDVSMFDGSVALNALAGAVFLRYGTVAGRETEMLNGGTIYDFYRTQDGEFLSVGGLESKFLADFLRAIGRSDLASPGATMYSLPNKQETKKTIAGIIEQKTLAEWSAIFAGYDACVEPTLNVKEMTEHPHTQARELVIEIDNNRGGKIRQLAHPIKFSISKPDYVHAAKHAGTDNEAVLGEIGFTAEEVESLRGSGALGGGR